VGTGDSAYVQTYGLDGHPIATFRVTDDPAPPTREMYERAIDQLLSQLPGAEDARRMAKEQFMKVPMPDRLPPYSGLLADPTGTLWVVVSAPGSTTTELRALSPDGTPLGTINVPVALQILEVGSDYFLGVQTPWDGGPAVVMYRYRRG
jgi:hypothetical protein